MCRFLQFEQNITVVEFALMERLVIAVAAYLITALCSRNIKIDLVDQGVAAF